MWFFFNVRMLSLSILLMQLSIASSRSLEARTGIKSATFLSPTFELTPGLCVRKDYFDIPFPKGHIAIKSFDAELVDEAGNPVPLHETYVHHWYVIRYFENISVSHSSEGNHQNIGEGRIFDRNNGVCYGTALPQYWGLGSETRGTTSKIPDPFAIEAGNPEEIPNGHREKWLINVMAIDTRGALDREGCTECRCHLYNVTKDFFGQPLEPDYKGGFRCCYDKTQCKLREGFEGPRRSLSLRYTVQWVDWDEYQVPVKIYILDSADNVKMSNDSKPIHFCQIEYDVPGNSSNGSPHVKKANIPMEKGGYIIYGVAHQHSGGAGMTLHGQDGRTLCTSTPKYGTGKEAGNEEGYVVGMSVCYPQPGSAKINDGETLTIKSHYNNIFRTGVMGHFYLLVAEQLPQQRQPNLFRPYISFNVSSNFT